MKKRITTCMLLAVAMLLPAEIKGSPQSHRGISTATGMMMQTGYVKFDVPDCRVRSTVHKFTTPRIGAGAMHPDGTMLCISLAEGPSGSAKCSQLLRFDPSEGTFSVIADLPDGSPTFLDMTWHAPSGVYLAIAQYQGSRACSLMKISPRGNSAEVTKLKDYDRFYFGITSDENGRLFFVDRNDGYLYWTDRTGNDVPLAEPTPISTQPLTGVTAKYISTIDMDRDSYLVYYAVTDPDGKVTLVSYDPVTGAATVQREVGSASKEITAMSIAQKGTAAIPAPASLKVSPKSAGAKEAEISWLPAAGASSYAIYLNGSLINETSGTTFSLSGLREGYNYLRVVSTDASGNNGAYADDFFYAGIDVPKAVSDVKTARVYPDSAMISWKAPSESVHGGYLSPTNIKYRITRFDSNGGSQVSAKTFRGERFIEQITEPGTYYYTIQSLSSDYGETYTTDKDFYGKAMAIPYRCKFSNKDDADKWITRTFPGNKYGWIWNDILGTMYTVPLTIGNDDWLIAPAVTLKENTEYMIYIKAATGAGVANSKTLKVNVGLSADTTQMKELKSLTIDNAAGTDPMQFRFVYKPDAAGEYRFALRDKSPAVNSYLSIYEFSVVENNLGHVKGTVTDVSTGKPLSEVEVSIEGTPLKSISDANGIYEIPFIEGDGTYTVKASLFGYDPYASASEISIPDGKLTTYDIAMTPVAEMNLSGTIADSLGNPLKDTRILLTNYGSPRETLTDAEGHYSIKAMKGGTYRMEVYKLRYRSIWSDVTVNNDSTIDIKLAGKVLAPSALVIDNAVDAAKISWNAPLDILRRDNNKPISQNGNREGNEKSLYGTVWRMPATVSSISWQTTAYLGPHNSINIWILDLTPEGVPSGKVIYSVRNIASEDEMWNKHVLPEPVKCPNGFYMAISQDKGMVSLATTDGKDSEWPFMPGVQFRTVDYTSGKWYSVDGIYINNNYMLRAECSGIDPDKDIADCKYTLWRFPEGEENNPEVWTKLAENTEAMEYTDPRTDLDGRYRYALACVYPDGRMSEKAISDVMDTKYAGIDNTISNAVRPYPNPVEETLHLGTVCDLANIYDLSGRLRVSERCTESLNLAALEKGLYLLEAIKDNNKVTIKIIKK